MNGSIGSHGPSKNDGKQWNFCGRAFMATMRLPVHFKDFLNLLNSNGVEYMVIGAYAVGHHGYPRLTGDLDVWVAIFPSNAARLVRVLEGFGFSPEAAAAAP